MGSPPSSWFANYQSHPLVVPQAALINALIIGIFLLVVLATLKRKQPGSLLGKDATDQAKGISIFFIMLGHVWVHVVGSSTLSLGEEGVFVFLFLSGFGLTVSAAAAPPPAPGAFLNRRLKRVMIPYWMATLVILLGDWLILNRTTPWPSLVATFVGFNRTEELKHLDYVRWYISFLLFWYGLYALTLRCWPRAKRVPDLLGGALVGFVVEYYWADMGWYQFLAFPLGCGLGEVRSRVEPWLTGYRRHLIWPGLALLLAAGLFRIFLEPVLAARIPSIVAKGFREGESLVFCLALLLVVGWLCANGLRSGFLLLCGKYAYELFLLHGALLIKYNPFFVSSEVALLPCLFWALILTLFLLSFGMQRAVARIGVVWPG